MVYHHTLSSYPCDVQWISPEIFLNWCYEEFARQLWTFRVSIWCLSQTFRLMVLQNIQDANIIGFHLGIDDDYFFQYLGNLPWCFFVPTIRNFWYLLVFRCNFSLISECRLPLFVWFSERICSDVCQGLKYSTMICHF